jgi:ABC-type bacteriocin/lantibiotic exporter with double-glycine peptidase domain
MIGYYITLINNSKSRLYFILYAILIFLNQVSFELFYLTINNFGFIFVILLSSIITYFAGITLYNFKKKYLLNELFKTNIEKIIIKLNKSDLSKINNWSPEKLFLINSHCNIIIENVLVIIEKIIEVALKILFFFVTIAFFNNIYMVFPFIFTVVIILISIRIIIKQKNNNYHIQDNHLHNFMYYIIHGKANHLIDIFTNQYNSIIEKSVHLDLVNYITQLHYSVVCIYLIFFHYYLSIDEKFYIVIFARNSCTLFSLIQLIFLTYQDIQKYLNEIQEIIKLQDRKKIEYYKLNDNFKIEIKKLNYDSNRKIDKPFEFSNNDKILIYGKSGAGKTTFFNVLKGLTNTDICDICIKQYFGGTEFTSKIKNGFIALSDNILYIRQNSFYYFEDKMSSFILEDNKYPNNELIKWLIEITKMDDIVVNLNYTINNKELSGGQVNRLILIKALYQLYTNKYKILLLDELDNGIEQELFVKILKSVFTSNYFVNKLIMVISHDKMLQNSKDLFTQKIHVTPSLIFRLD